MKKRIMKGGLPLLLCALLAFTGASPLFLGGSGNAYAQDSVTTQDLEPTKAGPTPAEEVVKPDITPANNYDVKLRIGSISYDGFRSNVGKEFYSKAIVDLSGNHASFPGGYVMVSIPTEYVSDKPDASTAVGVESIDISKSPDGANWQIKWKFTNLVGGDFVEIPFNFHQDNYAPKDGITTTVSLELVTAEGVSLGTTTQDYLGRYYPGYVYYNWHSVVDGAGREDPNNPGHIDPNMVKPVACRIQYQNTNKYSSGGYGRSDKFRMFATIPNGAVVSQQNFDEGWQYTNDNKAIWKDFFVKEDYTDTYVYFSFPGAAISVAPYHGNYKSRVTVCKPNGQGVLPETPQGSVSMEIGVGVNFTQGLIINNTLTGPSYTTYLPENRDQILHWNFTPVMPFENVPVNIEEVRHQAGFGSSQNIVTTNYRVELPDGTVLGRNQLVGVPWAGGYNREVIATNIVGNTDYPLNKKYMFVYLELTDPLVLRDNIQASQVKFILSTEYDKGWWDNGSIVNTSQHVDGIFQVKINGSNVNTSNRDSHVANTVSAPNPTVLGWITIPSTAYRDEPVTIRSYVTGSDVGKDDDIENPVHLILLQPGVEYVPGSGKFCGTAVTPEIVENYKGTGKTGIIYRHNQTIKGETKPEFTIDVKFTNGAAIGIQNVETYVDYKSKHRWVRTVDDIYDINNNGSTVDKVGYHNENLDFKPDTSYTGAMLVSDNNTDFGRAIEPVDSGNIVQFKMKIENNYRANKPPGRIINVLPGRGDMSQVTNKAGEYPARGSGFSVYLTGPVTPPEGYTVKYTTEVPSVDLLTNTMLDSDQIMEWNQVTAFALEPTGGKAFVQGEVIEVTYEAKVEENPACEDGEEAYNSFRYSGINGNLVETFSATVPLAKYKAYGTIFLDTNKNGIKDQGEEVLSDYTVKLINGDDNQLLSTMTTDENGKYSFTMLKRGNYKVSLEKKEGEEITTLGAGAPMINVFNPTGETEVFAALPAARAHEMDGGIYREPPVVPEPTEPEPPITPEVTKGEPTNGSPTTPSDVTGQGGKVVATGDIFDGILANLWMIISLIAVATVAKWKYKYRKN